MIRFAAALLPLAGFSEFMSGSQLRRLATGKVFFGIVVAFASNQAPAEQATPGSRGAVVVDTSDSPAARLQPFPLNAVRWTDGFWADRTAQMRTVTLRLWDLAADPEAGHVLENMRIAAGRSDREYYGTYWQDAWLYKWIAAAQQDDSYIATQVTTTGRTRFEDPNLHEVYTMRHLLTAACMHYRVTGKQTLLQVATRCADFLCGTLGVSVDPGFAHNPSAVMGLVDLYRVTGQRQYLGRGQ